MPNEQFSAILWQKKVTCDHDVHFVPDQHAEFYCARSLKQQFMGRHVTPLTLFRVSQSWLILLSAVCLANLESLVQPNWGSNYDLPMTTPNKLLLIRSYLHC